MGPGVGDGGIVDVRRTRSGSRVRHRGRPVRAAVPLFAVLLVVTACATDTSEPSQASPSPAADGPSDPVDPSEPRADEDRPPASDAPPEPPAPPTPRVVEVATWPVEHRAEKTGMAGFWWGPSAFAEVAQSILVPEAFDLEELRFGVQRTSGAKDWQTVPEEVIAFGHDVTWSGTVPDGRFRVTIWPLEDAGGPVIDMAGVPPITEQMVVADVPIAGYDGSQRAELRLPAPVRLEAGFYLVSLGIDGLGDPEVFNFYAWGRTYGVTDRAGFERDQGSMPCEYPESTTDYPSGRAYYRVFSVVARPTRLEDATTVFREHRAKVLADALQDCEYPDAFLPGDIELALIGR